MTDISTSFTIGSTTVSILNASLVVELGLQVAAERSVTLGQLQAAGAQGFLTFITTLPWKPIGTVDLEIPVNPGAALVNAIGLPIIRVQDDALFDLAVPSVTVDLRIDRLQDNITRALQFIQPVQAQLSSLALSPQLASTTPSISNGLATFAAMSNFTKVLQSARPLF